MSEQQNEPTVSESELQKSIESLMALLDSEAPETVPVEEAVEKSMVATLGGLADHAGAAPLNPELAMGGAEAAPLGEDEAEDHDDLVREQIGRMAHTTPVEDDKMKKSEVADEAVAPAEEAVMEEVVEDEAFAKSLAEAFAEQEAVVDAAASSEFAKSLVLGTIEGLSIAHEEFTKSLAALEARSDEKIVVLAKGLAAIAKAVEEIRAQVVAVSNQPVRPMAKSVQGVQVLEKSFGGSAPVDPVLFKSKVVASLEKRVAEGKLDAFQLVRYETTGVLDPALAKDIQSELGL